jgi:hypothetical protein
MGESARPSASIAWIVRRPAPATPLETKWCPINRGVPASGQVRSRLRTRSRDRVWPGLVRQAGQSVAMARDSKAYAVRVKADHHGGPDSEFASTHLDFDRSWPTGSLGVIDGEPLPGPADLLASALARCGLKSPTRTGGSLDSTLVGAPVPSLLVDKIGHRALSRSSMTVWLEPPSMTSRSEPSKPSQVWHRLQCVAGAL